MILPATGFRVAALSPVPAVASTEQRILRWALYALATVVALKGLLFFVALLTGRWIPIPGGFISPWAQFAQSWFYGCVGALLLVSGRGDLRSVSMGLILITIACTLSQYMVVSRAAEPWPITRFVGRVRTDAFLALLVWTFLSSFPRASIRAGVSRLFSTGCAVAGALGLGLFVSDAIVTFGGVPAHSGWVSEIAHLYSRRSIDGVDRFFSSQFLIMAPLLLLVPLKLRDADDDDRRRVRVMVWGVLIAFGPLIADTWFFETLWPGYNAMTEGTVFRQLRGLVVIMALSALPIAAAHAALVQRTLNVRLVVRAAAQYVLARYAIYALAVVPLVLAGIFVFQNRESSIADLAASPEGLLLAATAATALAAAVWRDRLLRLLDASYFREAADVQAILLEVTERLRRAASVEEVTDIAAKVATDAFHPERVTVLVGDSAGRLVAQNGDLADLPTTSALSQLVGSDQRPLAIESDAASLFARLPMPDRAWLDASGAHLLLPLLGARGDLAGIVALGARASEMPYSPGDRELLAALGSAFGLALARVTAPQEPAHLDPNFARECVECGSLADTDAIACACGAPLQRAPVPLVLRDLKFVRRIGAGGSAVVYYAMDLALRQPRAVKTLPPMHLAHIARLKHEARVMSSFRHENLATVFSLETFRDVPLIVMEFLSGGTLAERLHRGPLPRPEVLRIGIALADALTVLHDEDVFHRDVKPSNIGFTEQGVPKLLDFGLAKMTAPRTLDGTPPSPADSTWTAGLVTDRTGVFRGTPAYASPEALTGRSVAGGDDVWGLAVSLLEMCTGENPFQAPSPAAVSARVLVDDGRVDRATAGLDPPLAALFRELLRRDSQRLNDPRALARELRLLAGNPSDHKESHHAPIQRPEVDRQPHRR